MLRRAVLLLVLMLPASAAAQPSGTVHPGRSPWRATAGRLTLDRTVLLEQLRGRATVSVPAPDGTLERFRVVPAPVMEAGPDRAASGFEGYSGVGVDDPTATVRIDHSVLGVHASVRSPRGSWFVDPAAGGRYVSRAGGDAAGSSEAVDPGTPSAAPDRRALPAPGDPVIRRVYRFALASDPGYASAIDPVTSGATLNAKVTAAKETLVARLNQIYGEELGVALVLVANNSTLNFNTTSSYSAGCSTPVLGQNQTTVDSVIGSANYDVGHLVRGAGGGVSTQGVVGKANQKARGCSGLASPYGDAFGVDYFAHELGHQFGANHSFNGTASGCAGNRSAASAYEPASGSSIMSFVGTCGTDNLQAHADPYFSFRSIEEIQAYITADAAQGGTPTTTANHSPVVTAPAAKTIPNQTPFTLTGSATDADDDPLVYTWEQADLGPARSLTGTDPGAGPLFRQFSLRSTETDDDGKAYDAPGQNAPTASDATRTFPDLAQIAAGNTNAAGGCGGPAAAQLDCYSELLPAYTGAATRMLHFRLTARDRSPAGGGVSGAAVTLTVATAAGPFRVTAPAAPLTLVGGSPTMLTWNVAGTTSNGINASAVRITYSTDGGLTFPYELVASTANDGSEPVTVPDVATTAGRFRIQAVGNYFFDISHYDTTVTPAPASTATATATASPTTTATATATATATPTPTPSASPTPTATATPAAALAPDLRRVVKRPRVKRDRRLRITVTCRPAGPGTAPDRCTGTVRLMAKLGRRLRLVAKATFAISRAAPRATTLRLKRRAFAALLDHGKLKVTVRAVTKGGKASRPATLRPPQR